MCTLVNVGENLRTMNVQKLLGFLLLSMTVTSAQIPNLTVDYYTKLVEDFTQEAFFNPLPEDSYDYRPDTPQETNYGTFDYIVVGAGSAGAVIATRLSEREDLNILLLEAGGDENDFSDIPGMMGYLQGLRFNWNFKTVPQQHSCLGMINRQFPYVRGKALGGTSVLNGLLYSRGNKHDYDSWRNNGNPGWAYDDVLKYFIKSENSQIDGDRGYHGKGGLLNVEYSRPNSPIYDAFIAANLELGRKFLDYNGKDQLGVANVQTNTLRGKRASTGRAFLPTAANRRNLKVLPNSLVTKILINGNKEAHGVQFSHNKTLFKALASKEVVISAGAVSSPQILMLSGIGPKEELKRHNIPLIQNLAVGENLQDHISYNNLQFNSDIAEPVKTTEENVIEYLNDYGYYTFVRNSQGVGYFQTNLPNPRGVPDIEVLNFLPDVATLLLKRAPSFFTNETTAAISHNVDPTRTFSPWVIILHPKSRGTITLKSADPFDYPLIDPNYLSDDQDIETLYAGIQLVFQMVNTRAFKKINTTLVDATLPDCKEYQYLSKDYWYCQIRHLAAGAYHASGTCKMGPNPMKGDVVNHELKVHGIKNLRVADASILPAIVSGHVSAVATMIGEKVAAMILKDNCIKVELCL